MNLPKQHDSTHHRPDHGHVSLQKNRHTSLKLNLACVYGTYGGFFVGDPHTELMPQILGEQTQEPPQILSSSVPPIETTECRASNLYGTNTRSDYLVAPTCL